MKYQIQKPITAKIGMTSAGLTPTDDFFSAAGFFAAGVVGFFFH